MKRRRSIRAQRKAKEAALSEVAGTLFAKTGPTGMCSCGHTGDGPHSEHADRYAEGHGACTVAGCGYRQFSWVGRLPVGAR